MKPPILVMTLFFLANFIKAQELKPDAISGIYTVSEVVQIDSMRKEELLTKAKEWIALTYRSANDVIQLEDKEAGKIICKGSFSTSLFMKQGWIRHTLILEFKDNRFRYTYTDFSYYSSGSGEMSFESKSLGFKKKIFEETEGNIKSSVESLVKAFKVQQSSNDW